MLPSRPAEATIDDAIDGSRCDREGSKKVTVLTEEVWPRIVDVTLGEPPSRLCILVVWSPDAVSCTSALHNQRERGNVQS
jgi:hypothetical protein